jgi:anti-sigma regulatory factor (Ser/Thr protein kinase)
VPPMQNEWTCPAEPATVAHLRHALGEFAAGAGYSSGRVSDLRICVSEAVANSVVHGYRDGRVPGMITVCAQRTGEGLRVSVRDDGMGFVPRADSPGLGLGLPMIATLTSSMTIQDTPSGGTELCMAFAR